MNVGIIGLGNLGSAVGNLIAANGHSVLGWEHDPGVVREIQEKHTNTRFLPDVALQPGLQATADLNQALQERQAIFVSIPSAFIRVHLRLQIVLRRYGFECERRAANSTPCSP